MKIAFSLLVICYVCITQATLKHLKAKLKLSPATYRHLPSPVPVPLVYSSPVSTYSTHISTYSTVPHYASSYSVYAAPIYSLPVYRSPGLVYKKPLAIYEEPLAYEEPASVTLEASSVLGGHLIESHFSTYG